MKPTEHIDMKIVGTFIFVGLLLFSTIGMSVESISTEGWSSINYKNYTVEPTVEQPFRKVVSATGQIYRNWDFNWQLATGGMYGDGTETFPEGGWFQDNHAYHVGSATGGYDDVDGFDRTNWLSYTHNITPQEMIIFTRDQSTYDFDLQSKVDGGGTYPFIVYDNNISDLYGRDTYGDNYALWPDDLNFDHVDTEMWMTDRWGTYYPTLPACRVVLHKSGGYGGFTTLGGQLILEGAIMVVSHNAQKVSKHVDFLKYYYSKICDDRNNKTYWAAMSFAAKKVHGDDVVFGFGDMAKKKLSLFLPDQSIRYKRTEFYGGNRVDWNYFDHSFQLDKFTQMKNKHYTTDYDAQTLLDGESFTFEYTMDDYAYMTNGAYLVVSGHIMNASLSIAAGSSQGLDMSDPDQFSAYDALSGDLNLTVKYYDSVGEQWLPVNIFGERFLATENMIYNGSYTVYNGDWRMEFVPDEGWQWVEYGGIEHIEQYAASGVKTFTMYIDSSLMEQLSASNVQEHPAFLGPDGKLKFELTFWDDNDPENSFQCPYFELTRFEVIELSK